MTPRNLQFDQVAFSGGGIRCFWHGGFLSKVGAVGAIAPVRVSGVSGGALSGAAWIGEVEQDLFDLMRQAFDHNGDNLQVEKPNFTPHQELYRAVVSTTLDDHAIARICDGPQFEIVLGLPPRRISAQIAAIFATIAYKMDERLRRRPKLVLPGLLGMRALRVDARQAARDGDLVDLICAAATVPPVFDVPLWNGRRVLDGGMMDKAPLPQPDEGRTLVLLTSRYRNLPSSPRIIHVQPSQPVEADKIDFTDSAKVTATWQQGQRDAKSWLAGEDLQ